MTVPLLELKNVHKAYAGVEVLHGVDLAADRGEVIGVVGANGAGKSTLIKMLAGAEPIASYAGLRPAGRGRNYVIGPSSADPRLINVAAIRSTGLTASLGIAEHAVGLLADGGLELGGERELPAVEPVSAGEPWWSRAARRRAAV